MENIKTELVEVVPAVIDHIEYLKPRLRQADRDEVYAMAGRSAEKGLEEGFIRSEICWTGLWQGEPVACFGVRRVDFLTGSGIPWLLGSDLIDTDAGVKRAFIQLSRPYVQIEMCSRFSYLENWVDARNKKSLKWLHKCGFTVEPAQNVGFLGLPFHRFWLRS